jgi:hypothetical protein
MSLLHAIILLSLLALLQATTILPTGSFTVTVTATPATITHTVTICSGLAAPTISPPPPDHKIS